MAFDIVGLKEETEKTMMTLLADLIMLTVVNAASKCKIHRRKHAK